jgi:uncharacterized protein (TIGR03118 family)
MHSNAHTKMIPGPLATDSGARHSGPRILTIAVAALALNLGITLAPEPAAAAYVVQNLVSDLPGLAPNVDPNLVNPWGLTRSATSPWWVSDNGTGVATLYNGSGTPVSLVVTVPPPAGGTPPSAPTGVVFNPNSGTSFGGARFIFSTEDGTIAAWSGGTTAALKIDNSPFQSIYKGLAIGNNGSEDLIYATDFHNGKIDAFKTGSTPGTFVPAFLSGNFTDPTLPSGYAPFGIQNIGGKLYVTYALQDAAGKDDVAGLGHGFVDVFDTNGNLLRRFASDDTLNSPWGIALAPGNFGEFSNDLLVGNFGDGMISAFDPTTASFEGQLNIQIDRLWALQFGGGNANSGATNHLYFTAGINDESDGLFGFVAVPEPASGMLLLSALSLFGLGRLRQRHS